MKFRNFCGIRLENFAFKFDLRHFLEASKVLTLPFFAFKKIFGFFERKNCRKQGPTPLFPPRIYTNICKSPPNPKLQIQTQKILDVNTLFLRQRQSGVHSTVTDLARLRGWSTSR